MTEKNLTNFEILRLLFSMVYGTTAKTSSTALTIYERIRDFLENKW